MFYKIKSIDASSNANVAFWPGPTQYEWYGFKVDVYGAEEGPLHSEGFKVWPSVTFGKVNIAGSKEFSVYDITGREIINYKNIGKGVNSYDLSNFRSGVYFLKSKDSKEIRKVIKLK